MQKNLPEALRAIEGHALSSPDAAALLTPDGQAISYRSLWGNIVAIGKLLHNAGVGRDEVVAVLAPQGLTQAISVVGTLGYCACAPLQPRTVLEEVQRSLRSLSAAALIVSPEYETMGNLAADSGLVVVFARSDQPPEHWRIAQPAARPRPAASKSDAILYLMTSATTGTARVVPLSAANLDAGVSARQKALRLDANDRQLLMTSLCHVVGVENTLAQFLVGGSVIVTEGFDPLSYLKWLNQLQPTWYDCAPTVHKSALAVLKEMPPQTPTSLRFVQSAGAALPRETKEALQSILQIPVFNDYGMTEACPLAMDAFVENPSVDHSAGRACGIEIGIMDSLGELLSPKLEGEIVARGKAVFSGYLDDPDANAAAFRNGWFRTGDAGRVDAEGNLFISGRIKEMINRGGEKVAPAEVEAVFMSHPAVQEAVAFAVAHPTLGEDVACAVVLREATKSTELIGELRRYAMQHLSSFKMPRRIILVEQIPRNEMGKPLRRVLTESMSGSKASPMPAEITRQLLADQMVVNLHEIWARILERDDLGFEEDFFEAGGDSLAAINMLSEVDVRFNCQTSVSAASFLDEPTLAHLAALVRNQPQAASQHSDSDEIRIFPVYDEHSACRLFCMPADGAEGLYFRRLARYLRGKIALSIVRPANTRYNRSLFTFERAGAEAANLIRQVQPQGPYFVGGFCFGGVVAIETARELLRTGQEVRVLLFDVQVPGFPGLWRESKLWTDGVKRQFFRLCTSRNPGITRNLIKFTRRMLWSALSCSRESLAGIERTKWMRSIIRWAQLDDYPLYEVSPIDAQIFHILSADEPAIFDTFDAACRYRWMLFARRGLTERTVAFDHANVLHESNLPQIVEYLTDWYEQPPVMGSTIPEIK